GPNARLWFADHRHGFHRDEQVFLKEVLLEGRAGRAWRLEMPSVDLVKGLIKGLLAQSCRTTVLWEEGSHLDHVLQAPSQELQGGCHIGDGLLALSHHIGPSGSIPGQPPLGIKSHRAMQANHLAYPYSL